MQDANELVTDHVCIRFDFRILHVALRVMLQEFRP